MRHVAYIGLASSAKLFSTTIPMITMLTEDKGARGKRAALIWHKSDLAPWWEAIQLAGWRRFDPSLGPQAVRRLHRLPEVRCWLQSLEASASAACPEHTFLKPLHPISQSQVYLFARCLRPSVSSSSGSTGTSARRPTTRSLRARDRSARATGARFFMPPCTQIAALSGHHFRCAWLQPMIFGVLNIYSSRRARWRCVWGV